MNMGNRARTLKTVKMETVSVELLLVVANIVVAFIIALLAFFFHLVVKPYFHSSTARGVADELTEDPVVGVIVGDQVDEIAGDQVDEIAAVGDGGVGNGVFLMASSPFEAGIFEYDFFALLPEIFLVNATILLLVYGVLFSTFKQYDYPLLVCNVGWLGLLSVLITIALVAAGAPIAFANLLYNNGMKDNLTYFCEILLLLSTASTLVMCLEYFKRERLNAFESIVLILLSTCSMLFMVLACDLIAMYLAIELQSLCFYVIAALKRDSEFSTEAGLKYFILGAFSSGILLFGCSMIYGSTGITNFEELAKIFTGYELTKLGAQSSGIFMGILFIAVGFLFKITAVPFHVWAPDVYEGSPTLVTAFFSIAPKISIFANMLRVFFYSFYDPTWQQLFFFCSIASMILGALAAMAQKEVKRLLAYSSIGHVGYLLIGFSCGTIEGIQSLLIGIFIYISMTLNAFAIVLALRQPCVKYITDLGALAKTNPISAITLSVTMFSYAGIPPLAGFCSKFYLFFAALSCGAYLLAFIGIVTSVISCWAAGRGCLELVWEARPWSGSCTGRVAYQNVAGQMERTHLRKGK